MDDFVELILDIIIDGSMELLPNKKIPKWIRVIIAFILISLLIAIVVLGIVLLKETILGGTIIIVMGIVFLVFGFVKIKKYLKD